MIICGVDLETTGLDKNKDKVTEIGAVLWDTELNCPVKYFNKLVRLETPVPELIVKLTGITDDLLNKYGEPINEVIDAFDKFQMEADFLMAHNAPFDKGFLDRLITEYVDPTFEKDGGARNWIDSSVDVPYPELIQTRKLTHLACEHGFVNPFAHRAVTDVLTMFQVVSKYDWSVTIKNSKTPNITLRAMVSYDDNAKAKSNGYRWDGTKKQWIKNVKEDKVDQEIEKCLSLGFAVKKVG